MNVLLESALKVSIVLLAAQSAVVLLRGRSPALRHWVLGVAVACAWATPLLSEVLPSWLDAPLFWSSGGAPDVVRLRETGGASLEAAQVPGVTVETEVSIASVARSRAGTLTARDIVWGVWLLGGFAGVFTLLVGLARLKWLAGAARVTQLQSWVELGEQLRLSYGLRSPVQLLQSEHPSLLMTWGWARPKVLLPAAAREWSDDRVRVVLAHEFAHIARGDWAFQLAAEILRVVYWFNPLLWTACRRLRVESEFACDDAVLARGIEGSEYAMHLLDLARALKPRREGWLPAAAMARPSSLEGRIRAMLNNTRSRRPVSSLGRVTTIAGLLALTVAVAGLRAQPQFYSFTGTVLDPSNRVLPGTKVVLTNPVNHAKYEVQADGTGRFEFVGVPPAQYTLDVALPGFAKLSEEMGITGNTVRDLRLRVGSLEETVTVIGTAPAKQPDAASAERRQAAGRRFAEIAQREKARCAEVGAATSVGGNILPPLKLLDERPAYPEHLRLAKVEGIVTMDAVIGTDGTVWDVQNVKGPHPDLEAAAASAVRQWLFSTTLLNCEAIEVAMKVTTRFSVQP